MMIKVKHLMDRVEADDGARLWVEPVGLTRDLQQWCSVTSVLPMIGPPKVMWEWFAAHPLAYKSFRQFYHKHLDRCGLRPTLWELARLTTTADITLLHQGDDAEQNTAAALADYLVALGSCCSPDV